jgi:hypothetical protein
MVFAFQRESLGVDAILGSPLVSVKDILPSSAIRS